MLRGGIVSVLENLKENVIAGNESKVLEYTQKALDEGIDLEKILNDGFIPGMDVVGSKFQANEIYVPEMLISAKAMKAGMKILEPLLTEAGIEPIGKVVIGTVKGDLHDIGKNLVAMMLEGGGFEVIDAGVDITAQKFMDLVKENKPDILGLSALLTTTMVEIKNVIDAFKEEGLRDDVKIIVGGAPVSEDYAKDIGADGYSPDAASAVNLAKKLLGK
ncbi:corrinoid protein [candidate division WOR-3 bacterium]|nr:corrinoid protein [candidate division WOR-3 bacterium]